MIPVMLAAAGRRRTAVVSDPTLVMDYDFTAMSSLPAEWTFTGTSGGSYTDVAGATQTVGANTPRFDYHPTTHAPLGLLFGGQDEMAVTTLAGTTFSTSAGTLVVDFMTNASTATFQRFISVDNGISDGTERFMAFYMDSAINARSQYRPAGSTNYSVGTTGGAANAVQRVALAYAAANGATYGNGNANGTAYTGTSASVTVPLSATLVRLGKRINLDQPFSGWIRRVRLYNVRISNTDIATLTTVT
jgi:hypothetical protein